MGGVLLSNKHPPALHGSNHQDGVLPHAVCFSQVGRGLCPSSNSGVRVAGPPHLNDTTFSTQAFGVCYSRGRENCFCLEANPSPLVLARGGEKATLSLHSARKFNPCFPEGREGKDGTAEMSLTGKQGRGMACPSSHPVSTGQKYFHSKDKVFGALE